MNNTYIVVFPSIFSLYKTKLLLSNIKKILNLHNQRFNEIKNDNEIITIDANDPVFSSSIINMLFGIRRIAIAKKIKNDFNIIVDAISKVGYDLLLNNEKFYIRVDGYSPKYVTKDIEVAATSVLVEKTKGRSIKPGTVDDNDKTIYTYITNLNAYVCIFVDSGHNGLPYNTQHDKMLCCIYDEMSALTCTECIKIGFDVKVMICYSNRSDLLKLIKIVSSIIPNILNNKIELEFFKLTINGRIDKIKIINLTTLLLIKNAKIHNIKRISLALSPLIFSADIIDYFVNYVYKNKLISWLPLFTLDSINYLKSDIKKLSKLNISKVILDNKSYTNIVDNALSNKKTIIVNSDINNIHYILDALKVN